MPLPLIKFNVFGTFVAVERTSSGWTTFLFGVEGKRRPAGFEIPAFIAEDELCQYLADLLHESATTAHPDAFRLP